jgi:hypothetical protein
MRSERQIEASRANGAKSRGPVTPEGKRNSCGNALKHGLLADTIVLKGELKDRFLELLADFERELQPETTMEYLLVQKMAAAQWRQFRLWGMEKAAMEYQVRNQFDTVGRGESNATRASLAFQTLSDSSRSLDLLHRYDSLCDRQYLRAHKRFLELRRSRGDSPAPVPSSSEPEVASAPEPPALETQASGTSTPEALDQQPVWDPFIPGVSSGSQQGPAESAREKLSNEPGNSLKILEPVVANPAPEPDAPTQGAPGAGAIAAQRPNSGGNPRWNPAPRTVFCQPEHPVTLMLNVGRGPLHR